MNEGYVQAFHANGINTIEFFHPKSNSLPAELLAKLTHVIYEAGIDKNTRVIVLKSGGERSFCAGASFSELLAIQNEEQGLAFFSGFANVINAMRKCGKIIIGRVQGSCVGGGVGIAAAADYVLATKEAKLKLSELAIGIGPFVVGPAIERKAGLSAFSQLAIDAASWRSAEWAYHNGLFTSVFETAAQMDAAIDQLANSLAASNPDALRELKSIFWTNTQHWDNLLIERAKISGKLVLSDFTREAIAAFRRE